MYSALVFAPVNLETDTLVPGSFQGFVSAPSTRQGVELSATESWPTDFSLVLDKVKTGEISDASFLFVYETMLAPVIAAASGAISVVPDYLGYGESYTYNRAYYTKLPYQQSISLSWLAAKKFIAETASGCTVLEDSLLANGKKWMSLFLLTFSCLATFKRQPKRNHFSFDAHIMSFPFRFVVVIAENDPRQVMPKAHMRLLSVRWH